MSPTETEDSAGPRHRCPHGMGTEPCYWCVENVLLDVASLRARVDKLDAPTDVAVNPVSWKEMYDDAERRVGYWRRKYESCVDRAHAAEVRCGELVHEMADADAVIEAARALMADEGTDAVDGLMSALYGAVRRIGAERKRTP